MYKLLKLLERLFDIKGGVIVGLFSIEMLAIIAFYAVKGHELPTTVRDVYLGVLSCFAVHETAKVIKGEPKVEKDTKDEPKD